MITINGVSGYIKVLVNYKNGEWKKNQWLKEVLHTFIPNMQLMLTIGLAPVHTSFRLFILFQFIGLLCEMKVERRIPQMFITIENIIPKLHPRLIWILFHKNTIVNNVIKMEMTWFRSFKVDRLTIRHGITKNWVQIC